ncbi:hypothetical protein N1030_14810 [Desulfovibrio mangrovi]|uniref:hypothetical protein n=1 Tax=Desulfovibrio mangrovi TaxID=2976983 RepID=UPI002245E091|nr:hypothetical protein [Desulfovibrio mangrovi]UZP66865.1 hypothetical protein N1030_14810 [Desulfovibrio mangrovi]
MGDTGGDHDLWDYCVDDPVNANDPLGLFVFLLPFAAAAYGLNKSGTKAQAAVDNPLDTVANINSAMVEIAALPEVGAAGVQYAPQAAKMANQAGKAANLYAHIDKYLLVSEDVNGNTQLNISTNGNLTASGEGAADRMIAL